MYDYKYTSTKNYNQIGPVAYRQWRADSHCNLIHGYAMSFRFFFSTDELDARNWAFDYGGLKPLKEAIEGMFDHTLLVAEDDPKADIFKLLEKEGMAKLRWVPKTGCEGLADMLYEFVNEIFLPSCGQAEAERIWCTKVEVRETDNNMAYRAGDRPGRKIND